MRPTSVKGHFFPESGHQKNSETLPGRARRRAVDLPIAAPVSHPELLTAVEAMAFLGVKKQTLYAYVSRGMIRTAKTLRSSSYLYFREDIESLAIKGRRKGNQPNPAERALKWGGAPVLQSSITRLTNEGPSYRGKLAVNLVRENSSFERCAEYLWFSKWPASEPMWSEPGRTSEFDSFARSIENLALHCSFRTALVLTVEGYRASLPEQSVTKRENSLELARALLKVMTWTFGLLLEIPRFVYPGKQHSVAEAILICAGCVPTADAVKAINSCLVLCADHELATATFVARISSSAGADLISCISSALSSSAGMLAGVDCDACEAALLKPGGVSRYVSRIAVALSKKQMLPGFNHPAYPAGDPRGLLLMEIANTLASDPTRKSDFAQKIGKAKSELGLAPTVAAGLSAVTNALGMPRGSAGALMALSRTAGWIAHILEQQKNEYLIRPRSRYVGVRLSP